MTRKLIAGIVLGDALVARTMKPRPTREVALSWSNLLLFYFALLAFRGTLRDYAWNVSAGLTQGVLAITYIRFALFYLILRRLVYLRRWSYAAGFVLLELMLRARQGRLVRRRLRGEADEVYRGGGLDGRQAVHQELPERLGGRRRAMRQ